MAIDGLIILDPAGYAYGLPSLFLGYLNYKVSYTDVPSSSPVTPLFQQRIPYCTSKR
jgi:hypothetical protein